MPGLILDGASFGQIEVHGKTDDVTTYNATLVIVVITPELGLFNGGDSASLWYPFRLCVAAPSHLIATVLGCEGIECK